MEHKVVAGIFCSRSIGLKNRSELAHLAVAVSPPAQDTVIQQGRIDEPAGACRCDPRQSGTTDNSKLSPRYRTTPTKDRHQQLER